MTQTSFKRYARYSLYMNTVQRQTQQAPHAEPPPRAGEVACATPWSLAEPEQTILEIRDPALDVPDIMRRIRHNMAVREQLPPLAAALGRARMAEERQQLRKAILDLQERIDDFGIVDTHHTGWFAWVDVAVKKLLRKLVNRHLHQQQLVHERLLLVLDQIVAYLDENDQCFRSCIDRTERQRH